LGSNIVDRYDDIREPTVGRQNPRLISGIGNDLEIAVIK
jgi:hypothetical protein